MDVIRNINFRRPLNNSFLMVAIALTIICSFLLSLQWNESKNSYQRQNLRYIQNLASNTQKYLSGYGDMLDETIKQFIIYSKSVNNDEDKTRHWLFDRFNTMPDVRSMVYADLKGGYIRLPNIVLKDSVRKEIDPRNKIWFIDAINDDFNNLHFTSSRDALDNGSGTLTISKPLINNHDGEKIGVLAIRLNQDSTDNIINSAHSPLPGQKWIMTQTGQLVAGEKNNINQDLLDKIKPNLRQASSFFYLSDFDCWYFFSSIGNTDWYLIQMVHSTDLKPLVIGSCTNMIYCFASALLALFTSWLLVRNSLNSLYIRIANAIRNGSIEQKAAEELLYDEINNSTHQQQISKTESLTDSLTGLKNRRAFDNDISFFENSNQLCMGIIDIDNFKGVNDSYGHAIGDMVLKAVSDIGHRLRGLDNITLYRYGGEEIAVVFQDLSHKNALGFLERWREACEKRHFREANLRVTFSGGLCAKGHLSVEEAMSRADKMLYKAKNNGRNQIVSAPIEADWTDPIPVDDPAL